MLLVLLDLAQWFPFGPLKDSAVPNLAVLDIYVCITYKYIYVYTHSLTAPSSERDEPARDAERDNKGEPKTAESSTNVKGSG